MVFKYKRKTERGKGWTKESMQQAFQAVRIDKLAIREAARKYGIPYPTLQKHLIKDSTDQVNILTYFKCIHRFCFPGIHLIFVKYAVIESRTIQADFHRRTRKSAGELYSESRRRILWPRQRRFS